MVLSLTQRRGLEVKLLLRFWVEGNTSGGSYRLKQKSRVAFPSATRLSLANKTRGFPSPDHSGFGFSNFLNYQEQLAKVFVSPVIMNPDRASY